MAKKNRNRPTDRTRHRTEIAPRNHAAKRTLKALIGFAALPFCLAGATASWSLLGRAFPAGEALASDEAAWFLGGVCGCLILLAIFPRPVKTYVLGHELTHALWAFCMGGCFSNLRVSNEGGSVDVTRSNFLIMLAPYFVPFYTMLALAAFAITSLFIDTTAWTHPALAVIGFTWTFHICLTFLALLHDQSDISENGFLFSYVVIFLANLSLIMVAVIAVSPITWAEAAQEIHQQATGAYMAVLRELENVVSNIK